MSTDYPMNITRKTIMLLDHHILLEDGTKDMLSSAKVCLDDAHATLSAGDPELARARAEKGLAYLGYVRGVHYVT